MTKATHNEKKNMGVVKSILSIGKQNFWTNNRYLYM
jgi:hypothetical protein